MTRDVAADREVVRRTQNPIVIQQLVSSPGAISCRELEAAALDPPIRIS